MMKNDYRLKRMIIKREECIEWHRSSHEIVKYLPNCYNKEGHYERVEWTSMWDIGRTINGILVKKEDYLTMESNYVTFASEVMRESGCKLMTVVFWGGKIESCIPKLMKKSPLREEDYNLYQSVVGLKSGSRIPLDKTIGILQLALREWKDFVLVNLTHKVQIDVGYDLYLHVHSPLSQERLRSIAKSNHLFLDPRVKDLF